MYTNEQIKTKITDYFAGVRYADCYVGITENPKRRLFQDHNVSEDGAWIWVRAFNTQQARLVERHFLRMGMAGGPGGGHNDAAYVYAYLRGRMTIP